MIYLLGASGYVGQAYSRLLKLKNIPFRSLTRSEKDYGDANQFTQLLKSERPEFVINAAGYTGKPNVDACELQRTDCVLGNAVLPGIIAKSCSAAGIPWGHVSSGCIYTGARVDGSDFTEDDQPNFTFRQDNCSFYSGCKALGEEVLADVANCFIWRLRIPFNEVDSSRNYLSKMMRYDRLLEAENSISQLNEFVEATLACWEKKVPFGIYNVTNPGRVTTRRVVELIEESGVCRKDWLFFEDEDEFMEVAAKTPRSNCVMSADKLASVGIKMTPVEDAIRFALKNWIPEDSHSKRI